MATLFLSLSKNVSCTSTLQGKHLCQISWELVKTEEVVRDARLATARPPDRIGDRPPDRRHADSYIPPLYTTCMRGYNDTHRHMGGAQDFSSGHIWGKNKWYSGKRLPFWVTFYFLLSKRLLCVLHEYSLLWLIWDRGTFFCTEKKKVHEIVK